jgi:ribonucleoside-diphosphate reductase alpha chain
MRTLQFAGMPIFRSNARAFNCSYAALTTWKDFSDLFWLMMNGVGTGYSVQQHHIDQLPVVAEGNDGIVTLPDTKEGWADGLFYLLGNPKVKFDLSLIRPKGSPISSGGTASGPEPLAAAYEQIRGVLQNATGRRLRPVEAFDIMCYIADVVVVGGVRRAATICLFDASDKEMLTAKMGTWWDENPQRARANISAVVYRDGTERDVIEEVLDNTFHNETGEPGIFLTNDKDLGTNPCSEISLRDHGLCNLSEVNVAACETEEEFLAAVESAAILGTLQASYTYFSYIQESWRQNNEEEALLGISLTGQAQNWELLTAETLQKGARRAIEVNEEWAEKLEINPAKRVTTTKPSGSTSAWWGTTSGIHAAHAPYYLRRVRVDRKDAFGKYLIDTFGEEPANSGSFIESDEWAPENIIVSIPISMEGAILRNEESAVDLMNRAQHIYNNWIVPGHVKGENTHNVSLTVNYHPHEEDEIRDWMTTNVGSWAGISLLPYDGGSYSQAPFEAISQEQYEEWLTKIPMGVDFGSIDFSDSSDNRLGEVACAGPNGCEIT